MGYSTQALVENILANALTRGTSDGMPVNIINIGNELRDTVDTSTLVQYIRWADEVIDGSLSVIYKVPLKRIVKGEFEILSNIAIGDSSLYIEDSSRFFNGDIIIITDRTNSEKKIISSITDENTIVVSTPFSNGFLSSNTSVQRLGFPDPIPLVSARFAAANLYDKKFAAQASPNVSQYGTTLRSMAENDLNSVLNGRVRLIGQRWLGRRFFNPALLDVNAIASKEKNREQAQS